MCCWKITRVYVEKLREGPEYVEHGYYTHDGGKERVDFYRMSWEYRPGQVVIHSRRLGGVLHRLSHLFGSCATIRT